MPPDDVQPAEGQGGGDGDSGLYDLDSVTPEVREVLEPHLKAIEGNATKKFQEAAAYRKQWEPFEELGIQDTDPQALQQLLQFAEMANDPEQFKAWVSERAQELELLDSPDLSDQDLLDEDLTQEKVEELISQKMAEFQQSQEQKTQAQQEQQALEEQAAQQITSALEQIRKDNPNLPEEADDAIVRLAYSYAEDDPQNAIERGFEDYKSMTGQAEKGLFAQKSGQPAPPEGPGAPATSPDAITSFGDPKLKEAATERLRKSLNS